MARKYYQGKFSPKNPHKYLDNVNEIFYRSSWELKFMIWLDNNENVVAWGSENKIIPYISPIDNQPHRYFVDFFVKIKNKTGQVKCYLIEIKPKKEMFPPKPKKKITKAYIEEVKTYGINTAKWKYAEEYAKDRGWEFKILNENDLGIQ